MGRLRTRLAIYVGSLVALVAVYTMTYRWGMAVFEGEHRRWFHALETVVQSMTTTGYGQDAPWESVQMTALMLLIQVTGIAYIFVAFPLFVVPWLETLVQPTPPEGIEGVEDHVIVVGYTDRFDTLVDELEASGTPYVILEPDADRAQDLHENDLVVVHGDPSTDDGLTAAQFDDAIAVVIDASEDEFVDTALTIEAQEASVSVLVLVADPSRARYYRYAGVDEVLAPKHRLGKALGDRVRNVVEPALGDELELGTELDVREFPVDPEAELFGETLASCRRLERTGATVLGAWVRGDFVTRLSAQVEVDENTTLLVAGLDDQLDRIADLTGTAGTRYQAASEPVVVVGAGQVGRTTIGSLERAGLETVVVDHHEAEPVDVVGDATNEQTLLDARIEEAETVVIALEADEDALLTTLTARSLVPDIEIVVGVDSRASVPTVRAAGAEYVLSIPNVAGRMITLRVFDREVMPLADRLRLTRIEPSGLAGETISSAELTDRTDCTVIAHERDGTLDTDVERVRLEPGDGLVIAGTERQLEQFREAFGA